VQLGALNQNTHQTTTASDGTFSIGGLGDGDLTIVAEQPEIGRSKSLRVTPDMQNQSELVLELQGFGSLSGTVRQNGTAMPNVRVSCQSTTTPGSIYMVISGPDGTYRYDRLAPDTYKVSATIGSLRTGMQFYSQQVSVPIGQAVQLDLQVTPGDITLDVAAVPGSGTLTLAGAWLANGVITAKTGSDLSLALAGAGAGSSQFATVRGSAPAAFAQLAPAQYSACVVPLPTQVTGLNALGYIDRHGDKLPAYCMPVTVQPSPETQSVSIPVQIPPYIGDGSGSGSGSGS
ncbi:MAG TPA: carboxypeptidase-like regulatory domain-containing protein, partial [Kofleriaceae bacterium]|nr:carboxypeptidase-like regulatory domain-containing protein [Kofleriaceae bacterium]